MVLSWFKPVNRGINKKNDQYLNCTIFKPSSTNSNQAPPFKPASFKNYFAHLLNDLGSDLDVRSANLPYLVIKKPGQTSFGRY